VLCFKWDLNWGLVTWLAWIDNKLCIATVKHIEHEKKPLKKHFKCEHMGMAKLRYYIVCMLDISSDGRRLKMMQSMLVQSLTDEFEDIPQGTALLVSAKSGNILTKCKNSPKLSSKNHSCDISPKLG
jgi:hypothetical protein